MKVVGLLSWYDEAPSWLAATVASFGKIIDHLVAVDGAYANYPGGRARSDDTQAEVIMRTCDAMNIGLTLARPRDRWFGNEVEKRSYLFDLALREVTPYRDWFVVFDGDEVLTKYPSDLRTRLEYMPEHAAEVTLWNRESWGELAPDAATSMPLPSESRSSLRMFFRATPGMRVHGRHDVYVGQAEDGADIILWGPDVIDPTPAANLLTVEVEHRSTKRDAARRAAAAEYYRVRDALGLETIGARMMETVDGNVAEIA